MPGHYGKMMKGKKGNKKVTGNRKKTRHGQRW